MNQFLINILQLLICVPFIGFLLGIVLFSIFFFLIYNPIGIFKFKNISKIAREEHLDKHQWSYSTHMFQIMYFPDQIITSADSDKMVQAKERLIKHVKRGWKIAIWWMVIEALFFLGAVVIVSLAHFQK